MYATPDAGDFGCTSLNSTGWPANPVVMVDRGSCHFVKKARAAEEAGAIAMVVADNQPLCGEGSCTDCPTACSGYHGSCQCRLPYMVRV